MSARWLYSRSPSFIAAGVIGVWPHRRLSRGVEPVMIRAGDDAYRKKEGQVQVLRELATVFFFFFFSARRLSFYGQAVNQWELSVVHLGINVRKGDSNDTSE